MICVTAAAFILGYLVMKKVDEFLSENCGRLQGKRDCRTLKIAFDNSALIETTAGLLEHFSQGHPNCMMELFFCNSEEIMNKLADGRIDVAFFCTDRSPVTNREYKSVCIEPTKPGEVATTAVWRECGENTEEFFAGFLY